MNDLEEELRSVIRAVPDFPKRGIVFRDITPVLMEPSLCGRVLDAMANIYSKQEIDKIAGIDSRGFLFGFMLAQRLGKPFVMVRKKGKLPYDTLQHAYELEYGSAEIEIHTDAVEPGEKVLIHDDLLATGGTADAAAHLVKKAGGTVAGFSFFIELSGLNGVQLLETHSQNIVNLVAF